MDMVLRPGEAITWRWGHADPVGNNVENYKKELEALQSDSWTNMQAEVGQAGGMGRSWAGSLARFLIANPAAGISRNVHHILVWRDRVEIQPLNLTKISSDGKRTNYQMPQVASGWAEFVRFPKKAGLSASEARA
jgi:hypothetical protein